MEDVFVRVKLGSKSGKDYPIKNTVRNIPYRIWD
jgi:hypothetical protein